MELSYSFALQPCLGSGAPGSVNAVPVPVLVQERRGGEFSVSTLRLCVLVDEHLPVPN